jgi:hypothetical protein
MMMGARERKTLISTFALSHYYLFLCLHLPNFSPHFPSLEHKWLWCCQYIFRVESLKAQTLQAFSFLVITIGGPPDHGCNLHLHGPLPFSLLVVATNDPRLWSFWLWSRSWSSSSFFFFFVTIVGNIPNHGHYLGLRGPPPFLFLVATTSDPPSCGRDLDICLPFPLFYLELFVILLNFKP